MYSFVSKCESDTINIGKKFAMYLEKGDIIILSGNLGSGKTKFTEGFLAYFNLENQVYSPTFTVINEYNLPTTNLYHFDVYRLNSPDDFYSIGAEEYLSNGICIIEWGEKIESILPKNYIKIVFSKDYSQEGVRILKCTAVGEKLEKVLERIETSDNEDT
ncbi:MAG: tRNA (adenosine(37)-N6)-threonylcarbamoyltransferase complex ATPase subunit type 1 TsaE [Lachnospiraceae bacterium]|nr:tRNA (adenosine(37)-N6)-threonylcarbamoyltransferase complex ATPase subunit type 1 TsaE [Lachnospiraceae bacterium]